MADGLPERAHPLGWVTLLRSPDQRLGQLPADHVVLGEVETAGRILILRIEDSLEISDGVIDVAVVQIDQPAEVAGGPPGSGRIALTRFRECQAGLLIRRRCVMNAG